MSLTLTLMTETQKQLSYSLTSPAVCLTVEETCSEKYSAANALGNDFSDDLNKQEDETEENMETVCLTVEETCSEMCSAADALGNDFSDDLNKQEDETEENMETKGGIISADADLFSEDISSKIIFNLSDDIQEHSGFTLKSTANGHFLKKNRDVESPFDLNFRDNDRLLAINGNLAVYWNHEIVLESLSYILCCSQNTEPVTFIIDRQSEDGSIGIFQIEIKINRGRENHDIDIDMGDFRIEIKSFLKRISYNPRMRCVKFKELFKCKIRHGARTNCYLTVDQYQKLAIEPHKNADDFSTFDCFMFHGLRLCQSRREPPSSMFICVLRLCHSFDGQRPYLMAKSCEKIGIMVFRTLELDARRTEKVDPRFFRVTKTSNGKQLFESLIYKGYYLSWNNLSNKVKLTKHTSDEISVAAENLQECHFEFVPC